MSRFGKCQNQAGCLLAYRGEETEIEDGQPFICAECGKALTAVKPPATMWLKYLAGLGIAGGLGIVVLLAIPSTRAMIKPHKSHDETPVPRTTDEIPPEVPAQTEEPNSTEPVAEPPPRTVAPAQLDLDLSKKENKVVKAEVLTRVDLMPTVSNSNKDKLYSAVERARKMGKVLTIPFASGKTDLSASDVQALKAELEKSDLAHLRDDPTAVFVILGYADPKGDAKKNIAISQTRGEAVLKAMREKCGVQNMMHTVGMGGSKLVDAQNLEKNRIVEVWAVLP